jgi:hypothetical protein
MKAVVRRIQFPAQPVSYRKDWFRNLRPSFSRDGKKRTCRHRVAGHEAQELAKEVIAPYSIERVTESRIHIIAVRRCVSLNSRGTFPKFFAFGLITVQRSVGFPQPAPSLHRRNRAVCRSSIRPLTSHSLYLRR